MFFVRSIGTTPRALKQYIDTDKRGKHKLFFLPAFPYEPYFGSKSTVNGCFIGLFSKIFLL